MRCSGLPWCVLWAHRLVSRRARCRVGHRASRVLQEPVPADVDRQHAHRPAQGRAVQDGACALARRRLLCFVCATDPRPGQLATTVQRNAMLGSSAPSTAPSSIVGPIPGRRIARVASVDFCATARSRKHAPPFGRRWCYQTVSSAAGAGVWPSKSCGRSGDAAAPASSSRPERSALFQAPRCSPVNLLASMQSSRHASEQQAQRSPLDPPGLHL